MSDSGSGEQSETLAIRFGIGVLYVIDGWGATDGRDVVVRLLLHHMTFEDVVLLFATFLPLLYAIPPVCHLVADTLRHYCACRDAGDSADRMRPTHTVEENGIPVAATFLPLPVPVRIGHSAPLSATSFCMALVCVWQTLLGCAHWFTCRIFFHERTRGRRFSFKVRAAAASSPILFPVANAEPLTSAHVWVSVCLVMPATTIRARAASATPGFGGLKRPVALFRSLSGPLQRVRRALHRVEV